MKKLNIKNFSCKTVQNVDILQIGNSKIFEAGPKGCWYLLFSIVKHTRGEKKLVATTHLSKPKLIQPFKSKQAKPLLDTKYIFLRFGFKNISKDS